MNQSIILMPMGLNSFGLDAFYICAQEKNFTRAADRLYMTQSALSQRIKNLEEEIGATLFIRDRLGVRLTAQGESLLRYCQTRNQLEQELANEISQNPKDLSGMLRIGGYSSIMRSLILTTCQAITDKFPKVQLQLQSKELFELSELLKSASVDFIITDQKLEKEGIKSLLLGYEHNLRIRKKGTEFTGYFLDHDEKDETTLKYLKLKSGAKIKRHFMDDIYGLIDGVKLGLGDAIVPKHLIKDIKGIEVIDKETSLRSPVYVHFYDHPISSKLSEVFLEKLIITSKEILT